MNCPPAYTGYSCYCRNRSCTRSNRYYRSSGRTHSWTTRYRRTLLGRHSWVPLPDRLRCRISSRWQKHMWNTGGYRVYNQWSIRHRSSHCCSSRSSRTTSGAPSNDWPHNRSSIMGRSRTNSLHTSGHRAIRHTTPSSAPQLAARVHPIGLSPAYSSINNYQPIITIVPSSPINIPYSLFSNYFLFPLPLSL